MSNQKQTEKILLDLENAYEAALEKGNVTAAIKAKEIILRYSENASKSQLNTKNFIRFCESISEKDLKDLIALLKEHMGSH